MNQKQPPVTQSHYVRTFTSRILLCTMLVFTVTGPAYAYVDPGMASIVLQGVIGAIAVTALYFRGWISRTLGLFNRGRQNKDSLSSHNPVEVEERETDDR